MSAALGHDRVDATPLKAWTISRHEEHHTQDRDGQLPFASRDSHLQTSMGALPWEGTQHRERLKPSHPILHLLLSILWHQIQHCFKQSGLPSLISMRPIITPDRAELLQIWNRPSRATSANVRHKILHRLKITTHGLEWLVTVLPLAEPDL